MTTSGPTLGALRGSMHPTPTSRNTILAFLIAIVPLILGDRFRREIALAGAYIFLAVTEFQMFVADRSTVSANNLVLYPMIACYVGWFFRHRVARATVVDSDIEDDLLSRLRLRTGDTWSYGIAFAVNQDTASALIDRADRDLYSRKRSRKDAGRS
jgi:hypothetical protein